MDQQKFGRYEIISELGRGGMATVYKAYDPRFEREVAIKILPRELQHDPQFRARFEREAKTVASLEHQSIVPVYDVGEEDGQPYFVMRCMSGGSLADIIARGAMALSDAAWVIAQLAPALDEAHRKGIIHRDLKPGNILFDRGGDPYISDFGIAKMTLSQNVTATGGGIIGTPAYMSPEQAQDEQVDGRSDVYALGVIAFEMLTGSQPYHATTPMAVVLKKITEPVPHILDTNPELPVGLEAVIEKAMAKSPNERFSSVGEFSAALSAVAGGRDVEAAIKNAAQVQLPTARPAAILEATRVSQGNLRAATPAPIQAVLPGQPATKGRPVWLFIAGGLLATLLLATGMLASLKACPAFLPGLPWCPSPAATLPQATAPEPPAAGPAPSPSPRPPATTAPSPAPTSAAPVETPASTPGTGAVAAPVPHSAGGADKVAFIASNEVWLMNIDGSDLRVLTSNNVPKTNLQWVPGENRLVFISGTSVYQLDAQTGQMDTILSFRFARLLDEFRISPDGRQVAISLNREMYIVPFDLARLKTVGGRDGLIAMKGCLAYTGNTLAAIHLKAFRWGKDGKTVAWLFEGVGTNGRAADIIRVTNISSCNPQKLSIQDEFPGARFTPEGFNTNPLLPDFDWDGTFLFLMNTYDRNNGWGYLYLYSGELHSGFQENPISGSRSRCCYRDARWSPDGSYIFFAFQNKDISNAAQQFYYVPAEDIRSGAALTPIPMPEGFFTNPREAPQPALHPAE
ncbi:MAG TPA: protein kinase [Anaerolineales bacterium]|jgi:serine/threonine-protein kinase